MFLNLLELNNDHLAENLMHTSSRVGLWPEKGDLKYVSKLAYVLDVKSSKLMMTANYMCASYLIVLCLAPDMG